jgi:hypothetical protein
MKKISKEKQAHLALVALATFGAIGAIWYFVISEQKNHIKNIAKACLNVEAEKAKEKRVVKTADALLGELQLATNHLYSSEMSMPSGDVYSWVVSSIKQFNVPSYRVTINQVGTPDVTDVRLIPGFPYTQVSVAINGSAYYYDLGKFIADLENQHPYLRVQNLYLDPNNSPDPREHEKMFFKMEIINLVRPSQTLVASQ